MASWGLLPNFKQVLNRTGMDLHGRHDASLDLQISLFASNVSWHSSWKSHEYLNTRVKRFSPLMIKILLLQGTNKHEQHPSTLKKWAVIQHAMFAIWNPFPITLGIRHSAYVIEILFIAWNFLFSSSGRVTLSRSGMHRAFFTSIWFIKAIS